MRRLVVSSALALGLALALAGQAAAWTWPLRGAVLRPYSLGADPYAGGQHRGIDVAGSPGEDVLAPASGTVSFAGTVPTHGRVVTIQTAEGLSVSLTHLGSVRTVRGATVAEGEVLGIAGASGVSEHDVPYVHLGIRVTADDQGYLDPARYLPARPTGAPPAAPAAASAPAAGTAGAPSSPAVVAPAAPTPTGSTGVPRVEAPPPPLTPPVGGDQTARAVGAPTPAPGSPAAGVAGASPVAPVPGGPGAGPAPGETGVATTDAPTTRSDVRAVGVGSTELEGAPVARRAPVEIVVGGERAGARGQAQAQAQGDGVVVEAGDRDVGGAATGGASAPAAAARAQRPIGREPAPAPIPGVQLPTAARQRVVVDPPRATPAIRAGERRGSWSVRTRLEPDRPAGVPDGRARHVAPVWRLVLGMLGLVALLSVVAAARAVTTGAAPSGGRLVGA